MTFVIVLLLSGLPLNSGFDNYHKIVVRDHVRMPKFRRSVRDVRRQIPKSIYQASTFFSLVIFLTIFFKFVFI